MIESASERNWHKPLLTKGSWRPTHAMGMSLPVTMSFISLVSYIIRQIGELETPYTSYCERFCTGFDEWEPVCNNTRLPDVLAAFSVTIPPPHTSPTNPDSPLWTLDELFLLPMGRLKYFKKLYGRLLKATQPGRNDYKVLAGAGEKLDRLLAILDARANIRAGSSTSAAPEVEDEVVVDLRSSSRSPKMQEHPPLEVTPGSESSSTRGSSLSSACVSAHMMSGFHHLRFPQCEILERHQFGLRRARTNRRFVNSSIRSREPFGCGKMHGYFHHEAKGKLLI